MKNIVAIFVLAALVMTSGQPPVQPAEANELPPVLQGSELHSVLGRLDFLEAELADVKASLAALEARCKCSQEAAKSAPVCNSGSCRPAQAGQPVRYVTAASSSSRSGWYPGKFLGRK